MKTLDEDEFDNLTEQYRKRYVSVMTEIARVLNRAGTFGGRNGKRN